MPIDFEYMDHIAVRVRDLDVSARWYEELLAFSIAHQWSNAWILQRGRTRLGLYVSPGAHAVDAPEAHLTLHHFAFFVTPEQMIAAEVFLKDKAVTFEGPKDSGYFWSLFVSDPDGYRVELITDHSYSPESQ